MLLTLSGGSFIKIQYNQPCGNQYFYFSHTPFNFHPYKYQTRGNQHILFFPHSFQPHHRQILCFEQHLSCLWQMISIWTILQISSLVKSYNTNFFLLFTVVLFIMVPLQKGATTAFIKPFHVLCVFFQFLCFIQFLQSTIPHLYRLFGNVSKQIWQSNITDK